MPYELIVDGFLAVLMAGVIFSAFILNQRISNLRKGHEEMNALITKLDAVTRSAQMSVEQLKNISADTQKEISSKINKARGLADELSVITQAGDNLAARLDQKLSGAAKDRKEDSKKATKKKTASARNAPVEVPVTEMDEEQEKVLAALKLAR
ncbi:MAG: hypothetical protein KAR62_06055 [Sphingomonadales bacterium]|nr:hypothetical protein [Sphingomonadales bacterium]